MYTYLLINFFVILVPLVYTFNRRLKFYKLYLPFFISTFIVGFVFIVWDVYFTKLGYWGFNADYLIGINLFTLPLEEVLFFFCIPYACVFSYHVLEVLSPVEDSFLVKKITYLFSAILLLVGFCFIDSYYTSITFVSLSIVLVIATRIINLKMFYRAYLILLLPFLLTDGILTGSFIESEVVWYNNEQNLGIRFFTIPIEDVFYGMLLILLNIIIYEALRNTFFKSYSKS